MPWGSRELSDARAVLQSTAVYCSLLQSIRRFLVTDGRVCGRDVRSSEGVWGRREPSKVHSRLHRLHEFVQRLNHCSPAVAGSARSAMQNGGGGLAGAPSGLAESPGIRLTSQEIYVEHSRRCAPAPPESRSQRKMQPVGYGDAARDVHAAWQTRAAMSSGTASVSSTRLCRILKAAACVNSCCMPASLSSPARASSNSGTTHTLPRPPTRQRTVHLVNLVSPGKKTFVCPRCHSVTTPRRANALELGDAHTQI